MVQTTCHVPDCGKELYQSKSGRKTLLCAAHEKEYRKGGLRLRALKAQAQAKTETPAKPKTTRKTGGATPKAKAA